LFFLLSPATTLTSQICPVSGAEKELNKPF